MEAKLAGPLSPLVFVVGAAVITGTAVIGIVAGPGLVACSQADDFSQCVSETFFGAAPPVVVADQDTEEPAATEAATTEIATAEPDAQVASADEDPVASDETVADQGADGQEDATVTFVAPQLDIVRVEPDGSAVLAGVASPSGAVRIFANDDEIGSEETSIAGEWAFVTETPLPEGGVELRIYDTLSEQFSESSVVVMVHEDRQAEPLVVASTPGEASEILQGFAAGAMDTASVADAAPATEDEPASEVAETEPVVQDPPLEVAQAPAEAVQDEAVVDQEAAEPAVEAPEDAVSETPASPAVDAQNEQETLEPVQETPAEPANDTPEAPAIAVEDEPVTEAPDTTEPEAPAVTADEDIVVAESPAQAQPESEAPVAPEPAQIEAPEPAQIEAPEPAQVEAPAAPVEQDATSEPVLEEDVAAAPADEPQAAEVVVAPPSIDAVEIDGDRNFFAGSGSDGYTVRLYVDNRVVATTTVTDGRWLVEAINVLTEANQRVRIDMIDDNGVVVGRAEVNFVLDLPDAADEVEAPIVVAEEREARSIPEPAAEEPAVEAEPATEPEPVAVPEPAAESAPEPAAEAVTEGAVEPEAVPQPEPVVTPEQVATPEPATEAPASEEPADVVATEPTEAVTETPAVEAPVETVEPQEAEVPTMVGVTQGGRTVSGRVIIRRGDNLWTIARRVYGEGVRYTQIYDANAAQIRDPDLIYPGQVFDLPETDMVIGADDE